MESRARTDAILSRIHPHAWYERPIPERHRLIFYLGHLEAFDWNQIGRGALGMPPVHAEFDDLFAAGIDPPEGELHRDKPRDWPSVDHVRAYCKTVRDRVDAVCQEASEQIMHVAIEHRLMHAETTAYLLHRLDPQHKISPPEDARGSGPSPGIVMKDIPAGMATLGRPPDEGFGWDNEYAAHAVHVPAFSISQHKVTNGQYLEYVEQGAALPPFWLRRHDHWFLRTMFGQIPLPLDWPVYVTQREAAAFARWKGMTLPTEAQFHRAAFGTSTGDERPYPWGEAPPSVVHGNFDFSRWDPLSVTATPAGDSAFGVSQLVGNGWEWTSTLFRPFEGFAPIPTYPGYSARFFDDDHFVVKGAGPHTAACFLRRSFRNWFRTGYPHAHAGFRCVQN